MPESANGRYPFVNRKVWEDSVGAIEADDDVDEDEDKDVDEGASAKIHLFRLYLMRHVRDRGPKDKTRLTVDLVHCA